MDYPSVLGSPATTLPSTLCSETVIEPSVTWRGNCIAPPFLLRVWKRASWIRRLSGMTLTPSMVKPFVDWWISSLLAGHALQCPSLAGVRAPRTCAGSGPVSLKSFAMWNPNGYFLRMYSGSCQSTLDGSLEKFSVTWPSSGMMLRGRCFELQTSERPTNGRGSSSWRTPAASDGEGGALDREKAIGHNPKWKLRDDAANWPTPTSDRHGPESKASKDARGSGGIDLQTTALNWGTPTARDWKDGACGPETWGEKGENSHLGRQVLTNVRDGPKSSNDGPNSLQRWPTPAAGDQKWRGTASTTKDRMERGKQIGLEAMARYVDPRPRLRLNPLFVSWLMGFPEGWVEVGPTSSEPWATRWFLSWRRKHLSLLQESLDG